MVLGQGLLTPDGIAYDWVSDTIYWSDMGTNIIGLYRYYSNQRIIEAMIRFCRVENYNINVDIETC